MRPISLRAPVAYTRPTPFPRTSSVPLNFVVGTVGRMQPVKDQLLLARAFVRALSIAPGLRAWLRLALVGDGPLRAQCDAVLVHAGVRDLAWRVGLRLPDGSSAEGIVRGRSRMCFLDPRHRLARA